MDWSRKTKSTEETGTTTSPVPHGKVITVPIQQVPGVSRRRLWVRTLQRNSHDSSPSPRVRDTRRVLGCHVQGSNDTRRHSEDWEVVRRTVLRSPTSPVQQWRPTPTFWSEYRTIDDRGTFTRGKLQRPPFSRRRMDDKGLYGVVTPARGVKQERTHLQIRAVSPTRRYPAPPWCQGTTP